MECPIAHSNTGCTHIPAENGYGRPASGAGWCARCGRVNCARIHPGIYFCRVLRSNGEGLAGPRWWVVRAALAGPGVSGVLWIAGVEMRERTTSPVGILMVVKRYQHRGSVPAGDLSLRAEPLKTGCEGLSCSCGGGWVAWIERSCRMIECLPDARRLDI